MWPTAHSSTATRRPPGRSTRASSASAALEIAARGRASSSRPRSRSSPSSNGSSWTSPTTRVDALAPRAASTIRGDYVERDDLRAELVAARARRTRPVPAADLEHAPRRGLARRPRTRRRSALGPVDELPRTSRCAGGESAPRVAYSRTRRTAGSSGGNCGSREHDAARPGRRAAAPCRRATRSPSRRRPRTRPRGSGRPRSGPRRRRAAARARANGRSTASSGRSRGRT